MYCTRADIEDVFGPANVVKWSDLDNTGDATAITARINRAIDLASESIDNRLRRSIYALPLATDDAPPITPATVVDMAATLAGVWLYESRGVEDWDENTGRPHHRLTWNRERVERTIREVLAGIQTLDAVQRVSENHPRGT